jgi:diguanylate cyclase (GGDEF)-like protein/PAS domain S-box-containing protein
MDTPANILLVEDSPIDAELTARVLQKAGITHRVTRVDTEQAFLDALAESPPDVIISDYSMPHFDGLAALGLAKKHAPHIPFLFLSGTIGEEVAIESLRRGAADYVLKSNLVRIASAVERALKESLERADKRRAEQELRIAQERFALFMQHLPGPAFIKALDGSFEYVNLSFEKLANSSRDALIGKKIGDLWPRNAELHATNDAWVKDNNRALRTFEDISHIDGDHSYLVHKFPIPDETGQPAFIGGIAIDITDRILAERKVARLSRIHALLSGINSAIVRVRSQQELLEDVCRIAVEEGGFKLVWISLSNDEEGTGFLTSASHPAVTHPIASDDRQTGARVALVGEVVRRDAPFVTSDAGLIASIEPAPDADRQKIMSIAALPLRMDARAVGALVLCAGETHIFDNEELHLLLDLAGDVSFALTYLENKSRLDYLAYYDSLTGLPNRTLCSDRIDQLVRSYVAGQRGAAIVVLDIERFSQINDSLGRQSGDNLLKLVAARLRKTFSFAATVARLGGDTFALVLGEIEEVADVARVLEEGLDEHLSEAFAVDGDELRLAFKCGIALFPGDGNDAEVLTRNAEMALKSAKASSRRYMFYAASMNVRIAEILRVENRLRTALVEEQFVLHYQPTMELRTGRIDGIEALLRWNDPGVGLVTPASFIRTLEETGMIVDVGLWVVRQAIADLRAWRAAGREVPRVSVNVSSLQLRQPGFVDDVLGAIRLSGGKSSDLSLEITESVIMENINDYVPKLKVLREAGIGIAIDDFGTGYSSLAYISRLPISVLKIDRSFITAMGETDEGATIVSTIISLARVLKLSVVAEGVESDAQLNLLRIMGCNTIQGFVFSRPVPAQSIERMLLTAPIAVDRVSQARG